MAAGIRPVGLAVGTPSAWLTPDEWKDERAPKTVGVYLLRAVDDDGVPIQWRTSATYDEGNKLMGEPTANFLQGVLYIGLAGRPVGVKGRPSRNTLVSRFKGDLIGSWKMGAKSHGDGKWPHDSREKYEDDAELKKNYPLDRIQACCIPLLPSAWTKRVRKDVQDILDEMDWDNAQQYVGFLEAWLIQKFIGCFGDKPRLNTRIEGEGESKFTEAKLDEHLLALERDVVESSFHIVPYDDGSRVFLHKSLAEHVMASLQSSGIRVEIDDEPLEDYEADAVEILHEVKHAGSAERVDYDAYTPSRSEFCLLIDPSTDAVTLESALRQALRTYEPEFLEYFVANPDSGEVTLVREPNPTLSLNAADSAEQSSS